MAIVTRTSKGSELSYAEMDNNLDELRDGVGAAVPATSGSGIQVGPVGGRQYAWHDMHARMEIDEDDVNKPANVIYRGGIKQRQYIESLSSSNCNIHIPHDYVPGTDLFIHVHWSHIGTLVTGGTTTWAFETIYAKGHDQAAFSAPVTTTVQQGANTAQYQHMVAETALSVTGGSANQLNTTDIEPDGVVIARLYLDSNDITVSSGLKPDPFVHFVDLHYQSTNVGTINKAPSFWSA